MYAGNVLNNRVTNQNLLSKTISLIIIMCERVVANCKPNRKIPVHCLPDKRIIESLTDNVRIQVNQRKMSEKVAQSRWILKYTNEIRNNIGKALYRMASHGASKTALYINYRQYRRMSHYELCSSCEIIVTELIELGYRVRHEEYVSGRLIKIYL